MCAVGSKEHVGCPEKADPKTGVSGKQGLKAWVWDPRFKRLPVLGFLQICSVLCLMSEDP